MRIQTARRASQIFFLVLFIWFCLVSSVGISPLQIRGWPVNWFLQLDPLVGVATLFSTWHVYRGLAWGLATVALTLFVGRFFCGWVCPFGTVQQAVGYLAGKGRRAADRFRGNRYHPAQRIKYVLLAGLLGAALGGSVAPLLLLEGSWGLAPLLLALLFALPILKIGDARKTSNILLFSATALLFFLVSAGLGRVAPRADAFPSSVQIGWLDPICLFQRFVNLVLIPAFDGAGRFGGGVRHVAVGAWLIGGVFLGALLLSLKHPRFYCRFICPLGALFGVISWFSVWRVGKSEPDCSQCKLCEVGCEGACNPSGEIRISECVLCMNCFHVCPEDLIGYRSRPSAAGERTLPDLTRRGALLSLSCGALLVPITRVNGILGRGWAAQLIRPPGALAEAEFLDRCIKCGQCMRICPTNVLQPALFQGGLEGFWTPVVMPRMGRSGCLINCVACGHVCPTAAIRPLDPTERHGSGAYAEAGPVRIGTAFIDRGRCLPWAMGRPCIVCQENCPVSPKAIGTEEVYQALPGGTLRVTAKNGAELGVSAVDPVQREIGTGDLYLHWRDTTGEKRARLTRIDAQRVDLDLEKAGLEPPRIGQLVEVQLRLLRPLIDPGRCIGCGICEHECPVSGWPAIRVSAENESRQPRHRFWIG